MLLTRQVPTGYLPPYLRELLDCLPSTLDVKAKETSTSWTISFELAGTEVIVNYIPFEGYAASASIKEERTVKSDPSQLASWIMDMARHEMQVKVEKWCSTLGFLAPKFK